VNRNLDRSPLSRDQLVDLAMATGRITAAQLEARLADAHNEALILSYLLDFTKDLRFAMMGRGELLLDTRTARNSPGADLTVAAR
jgi:hypothetical protein